MWNTHTHTHISMPIILSLIPLFRSSLYYFLSYVNQSNGHSYRVLTEALRQCLNFRFNSNHPVTCMDYRLVWLGVNIPNTGQSRHLSIELDFSTGMFLCRHHSKLKKCIVCDSIVQCRNPPRATLYIPNSSHSLGWPPRGLTLEAPSTPVISFDPDDQRTQTYSSSRPCWAGVSFVLHVRYHFPHPNSYVVSLLQYHSLRKAML